MLVLGLGLDTNGLINITATPAMVCYFCQVAIAYDDLFDGAVSAVFL